MEKGGLYRRENAVMADNPPPACGDPCAFVPLANACDNSVCACTRWANTGEGVAICAACVQAINSTLASAYLDQQRKCIAALVSMSITVTPTYSCSNMGTLPPFSLIFMCLAPFVPSDTPKTSKSSKPDTVTKTPTPTTVVFTGAAAVKQVAVGAVGFAGVVAGVLL